MSATETGIASPGQPDLPVEPGQAPNAQAKPTRSSTLAKDLLGSTVTLSVLAVLVALVVGGVLIAITDPGVQAAAGYFFARPADTLQAIWTAVSGAYSSLFQGSIYNFRVPTFAQGIRPLTETLNNATPLIAAGLGVALAFRIGLFNIGGQGQILVGAAAAGYIGFAVPMPPGIHLIVAVVVGIAAAAIWAGLVGLLKARTGAHEVIVTIMANYIAFYFISYLLRTPGALQAPGSTNPKSGPTLPTAQFPKLFGDQYNLNLGFVLVIAATIVFWYLLDRSSLGFRFRALGENPNAARVAGMKVDRLYVVGMLVSGALIGIAGAAQVLGTVTTGFTSGIDAGIGFDAITVALLGRSRPLGVFVAGLLFGALKAGGYGMQAANGIPVDIVLVLQSIIVLFIAAPPLVRAIFRLPTPVGTGGPLNGRKAVVTK